jgi:ribonuclease HI
VIRSGDGTSDVIGCGSDQHATNNQMEIAAALNALRHLSDRAQATIYSDSQYLVHTVQRRIPLWRAEGQLELPQQLWPDIPNFNLWHALAAELDRVTATFVWIPAHNGNADNELCDSLARQEAYDAAVQGSTVDAG